LKDKTVLLVDDEKKVLILLSDALKEKGFNVRTTTLPSEALKILQEDIIDAVVLDLVMPGINGIQTLQEIKKIQPLIPVIMLSGHGTIEKAVESLKLGACDFLEKPVSSDKIAVTLKNAISISGLQAEKKTLLETVREEYRMLGTSRVLQQIHRLIEKMAPTDSPVLITGESGTGKELVTRALHFKSPRAAKPFVALNCAAIPADLLESEMFGYEPGAFTGAHKSKPGLFQQAHSGTLFLDEISEMDLKLQAKLLRVLETKEIQPVGGTGVKKVDVRIVSATNKNLEHCIKEKTFREDLFYRAAVLTLHVPPLRQRTGDIPILIEHFSNQFCRQRKIATITFHPHTLELMKDYHWPGNIRQLKNLVEKIIILADEKEILPQTVLPYLSRPNGNGIEQANPTAETLEQTRQRVEKEKLILKLQELNQDYEAVAKALNISRATLFNKMKAYGVPGKRRR
jgi:two-component system nitrogen regulation response regulator NtrX